MPSNKTIDVGSWDEEYEKCKNDPYYFFSNYVTIEGKKPNLTRKQFNDCLKVIKGNYSPIKPRQRYK